MTDFIAASRGASCGPLTTGVAGLSLLLAMLIPCQTGYKTILSRCRPVGAEESGKARRPPA
ncbi:MAG: hypothetical protein Q4P24_11885 [Rhodobacterales bacterium]|nr:hypothetical protein [Rhodobacterales bacterium]